MVAIAVLDDYQNVALRMADWSGLQKAFAQGIPVTGLVGVEAECAGEGASHRISTDRASALSSHPPGMSNHPSWHSNSEALGTSVAGQSQWNERNAAGGH